MVRRVTWHIFLEIRAKVKIKQPLEKNSDKNFNNSEFRISCEHVMSKIWADGIEKIYDRQVYLFQKEILPQCFCKIFPLSGQFLEFEK